MCNMGDLSDRDPYVSHVWNTDRHAFAAKQPQMKIFGVQLVFEIVFMQSRLCIQSWEVVIKKGLFTFFWLFMPFTPVLYQYPTIFVRAAASRKEVLGILVVG